MTDLIDTTEMYLRTIIELEEENIVPLRARISERLGHSGPTVSQTVGRMERDGLVHVSDDRHLELTAEGRKIAIEVMRKHRLAERLLADVIGLEWEFVHEEACRWEHVMSEHVERRILDLLDGPTQSPYGNPIPGLEELGRPSAEPFMQGVANLIDCLSAEGQSTGVIRRLGEPVQNDSALLKDFADHGILPGEKITFRREGVRVVVNHPKFSENLDLPLDVAVHIFVEHSQ